MVLQKHTENAMDGVSKPEESLKKNGNKENTQDHGKSAVVTCIHKEEAELGKLDWHGAY